MYVCVCVFVCVHACSACVCVTMVICTRSLFSLNLCTCISRQKLWNSNVFFCLIYCRSSLCKTDVDNPEGIHVHPIEANVTAPSSGLNAIGNHVLGSSAEPQEGTQVPTASVHQKKKKKEFAGAHSIV